MNMKLFVKKYAPVFARTLSKCKSILNNKKFKERLCCFGILNPNTTIYLIRNRDYKTGLMSYYMTALGWTIYALEKGYKPVIDMQFYPNTYLDKDKEKKENSWEYFFLQPCGISLVEAYSSAKVILNSGSSNQYADPRNLYYNILSNKELADQVFDVVENRFSINRDIQDKIGIIHGNLFPTKENVIGVVCRGTDLINCKNHSKQPEVDELVEIVREKMKEWNARWIFLASDTDAAVSFFERAFPGVVLTNQCQRFDNYLEFNNHSDSLGDVRFGRENDGRLKGEEYLTTLLLLSKCDYLVGSLVGATVGAIVFNGGKYKNKEIIDKGVY